MTELVQVFGNSKPTIERQLASLRKAGTPVYAEKVAERHAKGGARVTYYDPASFDWAFPGSCLHQLTKVASGAEEKAVTPASVTDLFPSSRVMVTSEDFDPAAILLAQSDLPTGVYSDTGNVLEKHRELLPVLQAQTGSAARAQAIEQLAQAGDRG